MPLLDFKLSSDMKRSSRFDGPYSGKFFNGIAKGVARSIKEATLVTVLFSGAGGSPGSAFMQGILTANPFVMLPHVSYSLFSKNIRGIAMPKLASGISQVASNLRTDTTTVIQVVPGIANGIGTIFPGSIQLNKTIATSIIKSEMLKSGMRDYRTGLLPEASANIATAVAESLRNYLFTITYVIPVVGGTPAGTGSITLTGKFIS